MMMNGCFITMPSSTSDGGKQFEDVDMKYKLKGNQRGAGGTRLKKDEEGN